MRVRVGAGEGEGMGGECFKQDTGSHHRQPDSATTACARCQYRLPLIDRSFACFGLSSLVCLDKGMNTYKRTFALRLSIIIYPITRTQGAKPSTVEHRRCEDTARHPLAEAAPPPRFSRATIHHHRQDLCELALSEGAISVHIDRGNEIASQKVV